MNTKEINDISRDYYKWLTDNNKFIPIEDESLELFSPFLDYFGESISVNISKHGDKYLLSDYGETLWNLELFGIDLTKDKNSKKYQLLKNITTYDGLILDEEYNELKKLTTKKNLSQSLHDYIEAISNVSSLAVTKRENVISLFRDEVMQYFLENRDELYPHVFPDFRVQGKSQITHKFDLAFPGKQTEYIKIIKNVGINNTKNILFDWRDVQDFRNETYNTDSRLNIIHQDIETVSPTVLTMLEEYGVDIFSFREKDKIENKFSIKAS